MPDTFHFLQHGAASYLPITISIFVAFLTVSHLDLKYWIALGRVPTPRPTSEIEATGFGILKGLTLSAAISLVFLPFLIAQMAGVNYLANVFPYVMLLFFGIALWEVLDELLGFRSRSAHRNTKGDPFVHYHLVNRTTAVIAAIVSLTTAAHSLLLPDETSSAAVVLASLVIAGTRFKNTVKLKLRDRLYCMIIVSTTDTAIFGMLCIRVYSAISRDTSVENLQALFSHPHIQLLNQSWFTWLTMPGLLSFVGTILGMLLRFDHRLAAISSREIDSHTSFGVVAQPSQNRKLGPGIAIPFRFVAAFPKVYFHTALLAWLFTHIGVVLLYSLLAIDPDNAMPPILLIIASTWLSSFGILFAVGVLSWWNGDFEGLWCYEEAWSTGEAKSNPLVEYRDLEMDELRNDKKEETLLGLGFERFS